MCGYCLRKIEDISMPFISGMVMSVKMISGFNSSMREIASWPLSTAPMMAIPRLLQSMISDNPFWSRGLSSTIKSLYKRRIPFCCKRPVYERPHKFYTNILPKEYQRVKIKKRLCLFSIPFWVKNRYRKEKSVPCYAEISHAIIFV